MKKFLAVLLSLVLVLSLFGPATAALEEDTAPEEPAEAAVAAVEEEPVLPETAEAVTDEEPAAEEPAAEEAAEEPAEAAEEAEEEAVPEEPAEAAEPEAEEPAEAPAEAEAEAELPEEDAPVEEAVPEEEVIPAEEVIPEEEAAIEEEPAAEEPEEEAEPAEPTKYVKFEKKLDNVAVTAVAEAGAFDVPVELQVKTLIPGSAAYKEADKALTEEGYEYDGMLALDIGFADENGAPVEPAGPVSVSLKLITDGDVPADAESAAVAHIADDGVQLVADTADETEGTVTVDETAVSADFVVDSFSTFVITWTEGGQEMSATVHWGELGSDGSFTEFDAAVLDTTAASVSLRNSYSGYTYMSADYCAPGVDRENGVTILSELYKTDDGTWEYVRPATEDSEEQHVPLANGSHIYAYYFVPGSPNPSSSSSTTDIPAPTTTKNVVANGDGTYTIILDVEGNTVQEDDSHYANVLIILDATRSMEMNGSQKWANAKTAVQTLIDTLTTGDNSGNSGKIDFCLVTFGRAATLRDWTKDESGLKTTVSGLNTVTTSGTNWESGLRAGVAALGDNLPDSDPLYVIFLTDGDPNTYYTNTNSTNYDNSGTASGYNNSSTTSANRAYDEARTLAAAGKLYGIFCFDGTTVDTSSDSYRRLNGVITGTGQGGQETIGATADTIEQKFKDIAETIINDLGANNVQVDDGVPSLSNVSAAVAGEASGFEYQISTDGGETYSTWAEAPGASYSNDNGVTWDLAELGTVQPGASYRLKFTVWPSQEAYDLIADLNNGIKTMTDAELEEAGIAKSEDGVYTLKTNTHLKTTYTVGETTYTDEPDELAQAAMLLPTETIGVRKVWNNFIDQQNPPAGVKLILTRDGKDYLYGDNAVEVSKSTNWEKDDIFISLGQIRSTDSGYEILETGHDYEIVEPEDYEGDYRWELTSEIYHPMVINGTTTMLIKDDEATGTEGTDYYIIGGTKYKVSSGDNMLQAWNDRRSWLQIEKKVTGEGAPEDALFTFTVTINDANKEDIWYSAYGPNGIIKDLETNGTAQEGDTGYFYIASGTPITVQIQAGWTLRFLNLPSGTTYTIEETTLPDGFKYDSAEDRQTVDTAADQDAPQRPTIDDDGKVEGTINVPNVEFYVDYTNEYAETEIEITKVWEDNDDQIGGRPTAAQFKDDISLVVNDEATKDYNGEDYLTITDNEDGTYTIKYSGLPKYIDGEEAAYQVQETTVPEGYTASTTAAVENKGEITNTLKTGNLTITKTVESDLAADAETKFTFTITTDPTVNGKFKATGSTYTEVEFKEGKATVELADGETVTIEGLAAGVKYTVEEEEVEGFTTESDGEEGTISEEEAAEAEFTNTRETGDLTVTKELDSDLAADADKTFTITVTLSDDSISGTYGDMTFDGGVATVELKGGESATAEGLPTTVEYTVEEDDESAEGFEVDYDNEEGEIGEDLVTATVTNTRETGDLTVTKEVESDLAADADKTFTITVTLSDDSISGTYGDMTFDGGVATVELKGGESATAEGLP
ncbi:MAG: Cna B-type domain-containing protein, partial [Oscillospiraceae bacterium]|nr:Cna B-type domain-containing protein [Oscillospiraceae bacterium]